MPNDELYPPVWRDACAYAQALPKDKVSAEIKNALLANNHAKSPLKKGAAQTDLDAFFPSLIGGLRLADLGSPQYWIVMLVLSSIFLLCELLFVVMVAQNQKQLVNFALSLIVCLVVLGLLGGLYGFALWKDNRGAALPGLLKKIPPARFHEMPVFWVSIFSVGLNFYVVMQTGFSNSPFLPALLASAILVLGLPRENSPLVITLAILALVLGSIGAGYTQPVDKKVLDSWGGSDLAMKLNILTFLFSGITTVILRAIANYRLE
jgi:hypothetical protein